MPTTYYNLKGVSKSDILNRIDAWIKLNNIPCSSYDRGIKLINFDLISTKNDNTMLVEQYDMPAFLQPRLEYKIIVFFSYLQQDEVLFIFGYCLVDDLKVLDKVMLKDLYTKTTPSLELRLLKTLKLNDKITIFRYFGSTESDLMCTLYKDCNFLMDNNVEACMWRIKLMSVILSTLQNVADKTKTQLNEEMYYNIEQYLLINGMSDPKELLQKKYRTIDNHSYHICKLIHLFTNYQNLVEAERYFLNYKLHKFHYYEKDFMELLAQNDIDINYTKLENSKVNIKDFKAKYSKIEPNRPMFKYIFDTNWDRFGFSKDSHNDLILVQHGIVYFTYLDIGRYLAVRIQRDIDITIRTMKARRQMKAY